MRQPSSQGRAKGADREVARGMTKNNKDQARLVSALPRRRSRVARPVSANDLAVAAPTDTAEVCHDR